MEEEIELNGVKYIQKDSIKPTSSAKKLKNMKYVIVRTFSAGVFAGYLKQRKGKEGIIVNARRLWYWDGASSLSQLAMEGVKKPDNCKFAMEVDEIELTEIIEVLSVTEVARENIASVKVWKENDE